MKNKTKIMLGLSLLTAGTLAAGATGTFAWFTTNKTATATYSNIVAAATQGNISTSIAGITDTSITGGTKDKNATATGAKSKVSDVSSKDGINFAQPDWVEESGNTETIKFNSIKDVTSKPSYYTQYSVTVYNDATTDNSTATAVDVKLTGVEITGDSEIKENVRVAVIAEGYTVTSGYITAGTTHGVFSNNSQKTYVLAQDAAGTMKDALKNDATIVTAKATLDNSIVVKENLAADSNFSVGVSVWLEGTLADNQDTAISKVASVKLTFSASEHKDA